MQSRSSAAAARVAAEFADSAAVGAASANRDLPMAHGSSLAVVAPRDCTQQSNGVRRATRRPLRHDLLENASVRKWVVQAEDEAREQAGLTPRVHAPADCQPARQRPRIELEMQHELLDEADQAGDEAGDEAPTPRRRTQSMPIAPAEETPRHIHLTLLSAAAIQEARA